jgi:predicted DNA-binding protein (UPF0251 family)
MHLQEEACLSMEHNYYHEIYDCVTKETTVIPFTEEEIADFETKAAEIEAERLAAEEVLAEKEAAKQVVLDRLGLTAEEAKLILS